MLTARGLSQAELARRGGMSQQRLSKIESGATKNVTLDARRRLAPLGVEEDQLLRPVSYPIPPLDGEPTPGQLDLRALLETDQEILAVLREMNDRLNEIIALLLPDQT